MNITLADILEIERLDRNIKFLTDELQTSMEKMQEFEDALQSHPMFIELNENREEISKQLMINKPVIFPNGESLSIQCSNTHYCNPRANIKDVLMYSTFEIGFPSENLKGKELLDFSENEDVVGFVSKPTLLKIWELNQ